MQRKEALVEMALQPLVSVQVVEVAEVAQEQAQLIPMLVVTVVTECKDHRMRLLMVVLDPEDLHLQGTFLAAVAAEVIVMRLPEQVVMVVAVMEGLLLMRQGLPVAQILAAAGAAVETTLLQRQEEQAAQASSSLK